MSSKNDCSVGDSLSTMSCFLAFVCLEKQPVGGVFFAFLALEQSKCGGKLLQTELKLVRGQR
jgi:hypothetical protein